MMTAWSSKPPLSIAREKRIDRTPRRLSHQKTPACVVEAIVNSRSFPGFTTAPTAPNTHPIRPMKKVTFQNRATLAWRKARSSSLFSLPNERPWLGIRRLLPARPLIARDRASIRARRQVSGGEAGLARHRAATQRTSPTRFLTAPVSPPFAARWRRRSLLSALRCRCRLLVGGGSPFYRPSCLRHRDGQWDLRRCGSLRRLVRHGALSQVQVENPVLFRRLLFEVEHLPDDTHERLGGDAGQAPHRDPLLHGVPEGEERDRREVRVSNRAVEALGVLDGIGSAHGGPHFLGLGLRFSVSPEA